MQDNLKICMYIYIYSSVHIVEHIYMSLYIYICTHTCTYTHIVCTYTYMNNILFAFHILIHSFVVGHLSFCMLPSISSATVNIGVHMSLQMSAFA